MYTWLCFIVVIIYVYVTWKKYFASCASKVRLDGKTALITGGTSGIGLEIATDLSLRGAKVIVACPYEDEGRAAVETIKERTGKRVVFKILDLSSLKSVRRFAEDITRTEERLDILVNNAGVGTAGDFLTVDGLHIIMQVNYFGHFLLTLLLVPLLKKSGRPSDPSRIVNTSSVFHRFGKIDIDNLNRTSYWTQLRVYCNSKLCFILFAEQLAIRLVGSNVVVNCVDPGFVATSIYCSFNEILRYTLVPLIYILCNTSREGAQTSIHVAVDKEAGGVSGKLFKYCKVVEPVTMEWQWTEQLWDESVKLVQLDQNSLNNLLS